MKHILISTLIIITFNSYSWSELDRSVHEEGKLFFKCYQLKKLETRIYCLRKLLSEELAPHHVSKNLLFLSQIQGLNKTLKPCPHETVEKVAEIKKGLSYQCGTGLSGQSELRFILAYKKHLKIKRPKIRFIYEF